MNETDVKLYNRYNSDVYLENGSLLRLEDWMPISVHGDNPIVAIDPPGGPFIKVGDSINGADELGIVESITHTEKGFVITFKK